MTLAIESAYMLVINIGLFSVGMAFGIIGLALGVTRSMTKNKDHWALIFAMLSWTVALIIPDIWFSGIVFLMGAVALTISFMPIVQKADDKNIFILAIIVVIMNSFMIIGSGAFATSVSWQTTYDNAYGQLNNLFGEESIAFSNNQPDYSLCNPTEIRDDGTTCKSDAESGSFDKSLFVPFASILAIGTYIGKGLSFIGMTTLAPSIFGTTFIDNGYFDNAFIINLMSWFITLWQFAIFYKLILFVLNKRGAR